MGYAVLAENIRIVAIIFRQTRESTQTTSGSVLQILAKDKIASQYLQLYLQ